MELQEKQRRRQHSQPGHTLIDTGKKNVLQWGKTLHKCTCGWIGWLS